VNPTLRGIALVLIFLANLATAPELTMIDFAQNKIMMYVMRGNCGCSRKTVSNFGNLEKACHLVLQKKSYHFAKLVFARTKQ